MIKISHSCWDKKLALFHCSVAAVTIIRRVWCLRWLEVLITINYNQKQLVV